MMIDEAVKLFFFSHELIIHQLNSIITLIPNERFLILNGNSKSTSIHTLPHRNGISVEMNLIRKFCIRIITECFI